MQKTISFLKEATYHGSNNSYNAQVQMEGYHPAVQNRPVGMSAMQWMTENQVSDKSYYYWQRKLRKEAFEQLNHSSMLPAVKENTEVSFAELHIPERKNLSLMSFPKA